MAEYIDRTLLELDTEWSDYYDGFTSYSQSQIQDMPKADVIERSKVNKAIDKIKGLSVHANKIQVLKILQECIGEKSYGNIN